MNIIPTNHKRPTTFSLHALGAWRITAGFHDLLWNPALTVPASQLLGGPVRFWHDQLFCKRHITEVSSLGIRITPDGRARNRSAIRRAGSAWTIPPARTDVSSTFRGAIVGPIADSRDWRAIWRLSTKC